MEDIHATTAAIASGDPDAFARFYEEWFDRMYSIARATTKLDEATCLDIVQDAMIRVIKSCKPIENERALNAWVGKVVRCAAIDQLRAESRRRKREGAVARADRALESDEMNIDERIEWIRGEIASLDPDQARLLGLRYGRGLTLKQIGALFGIGHGAVHGRIERSLTSLRDQSGETIDD